MTRSFFLLILLAALAACVSYDTSSPYTETGAVCDNAGLESQLVSLQDRSRSISGSLAVVTNNGGGAIGISNTKTDVDRRYNLRNRLNKFDAEIDGQFRNLTSSCKAFTRCMEQNKYKEDKCNKTMQRWDDAETSFKDLSVRLRELEVEAKKITTSKKSRKSNRKKKCGYDGYQCPPSTPQNTCCDTINNIFTDCCDSH